MVWGDISIVYNKNDTVGANNTGEFIRRYSPDVVGANHAGEFIRPMSLVVVGANHAGEFIRRYSPDVPTKFHGIIQTSCRSPAWAE